MSNRVIIASDSTCDLSPELVEKYGIKILPLNVNLGGKTYSDGVDIDPDHVYKHYEETGELPKTAAANIFEFEEFIELYDRICLKRGFIMRGNEIDYERAGRTFITEFRNGKFGKITLE